MNSSSMETLYKQRDKHCHLLDNEPISTLIVQTDFFMLNKFIIYENEPPPHARKRIHYLDY